MPTDEPTLTPQGRATMGESDDGHLETPSVLSVVLRIAVIVSGLELAIMLGLGRVSGSGTGGRTAVIDTLLLCAGSTPFIYGLVILPFVRARDRAISRLAALAGRDDLTALLNRRALRDVLAQRLAESVRHGETVAIVYLDLDGFKAVNDAHGHAVGDALLREIASRLRAVVRAEDAVSRVGGDEFVIVLSRLSPAHHVATAEAWTAAEKIAAEVSVPFTTDGIRLGVIASIGVTVPETPAVPVDTLLGAADRAMYRAKQDAVQKIWLSGREVAPDLPLPAPP